MPLHHEHTNKQSAKQHVHNHATRIMRTIRQRTNTCDGFVPEGDVDFHELLPRLLKAVRNVHRAAEVRSAPGRRGGMLHHFCQAAISNSAPPGRLVAFDLSAQALPGRLGFIGDVVFWDREEVFWERGRHNPVGGEELLTMPNDPLQVRTVLRLNPLHVLLTNPHLHRRLRRRYWERRSMAARTKRRNPIRKHG